MNIEFADALNQAIAHFLSSVYTCLPVKVIEYFPDKKMVTIKPLIKVKFQDGEELSMPTIYFVPVIFQGTKNTVIQFEIKSGDTGLALFSTRSLELWLKGSGDEVSAGSPRKFSLTDAIFLPGLFPFNSPGKIGEGSGLEILHFDSKIHFKNNGDIDVEGTNININGDTVNINGDTKNFVTHTELDSALQTFVTALNALFASKLNGSGSPGSLVLNITTAKTDTVKTG